MRQLQRAKAMSLSSVPITQDAENLFSTSEAELLTADEDDSRRQQPKFRAAALVLGFVAGLRNYGKNTTPRKYMGFQFHEQGLSPRLWLSGGRLRFACSLLGYAPPDRCCWAMASLSSGLGASPLNVATL